MLQAVSIELGHAFRRRLEETGVTLCLEHEVLRIEYSGSDRHWRAGPRH